MVWRQLGEWWVDELADDPSYDQVILPLLVDMLEPQSGSTYLDIGSGEGRVMRSVREAGADAVGVDINETLARASQSVVAEIPPLPFADNSFDGAYALLVLEHVEDHAAVFAEAARVVRPGGVFALVINHPYWSAPGATPIADEDEDLWRPGAYYTPGHTDIEIRGHTVRFHHRSVGDLLTGAALAGWALARMEEHAHHDHSAAIDIPRLLAARWHNHKG